MKRKPKVFFHPIEGSAPLSISWYPGPYGDARESKEGNGVYFSSPYGELLAVQFDDVNEERDAQTLTAKSARVSIAFKAGKVSVKLTPNSKRVA